jgi:hypothetical protein
VKLIYEGNWHTYEEWGGVRIFEDEHGALWQQDGGYSVMGTADQHEWDEVYCVSYEAALNTITEWDQIEKNNEEFWDNNGW